jgi:hypothetical protein
MRSLILTLAAACMVVSGVAYSLHATLSPSSQSSTIADKATTVGKLDSDAIVEPEPPQEAMTAAVLRPSIEASQTTFLAPSIEASRTDSLAPSTHVSPTDFYDVAEEAPDNRTAAEITSGPPAADITSGPPPVAVAARVEQPVDQASLDQPAPAPKAPKQKNPKTTAKKPVSRDRANKDQHHATAVAAPEAKDQAIANNREPATGDVQEAASAATFPDPISKLRELFSAQ